MPWKRRLISLHFLPEWLRNMRWSVLATLRIWTAPGRSRTLYIQLFNLALPIPLV